VDLGSPTYNDLRQGLWNLVGNANDATVVANKLHSCGESTQIIQDAVTAAFNGKKNVTGDNIYKAASERLNNYPDIEILRRLSAMKGQTFTNALQFYEIYGQPNLISPIRADIAAARYTLALQRANYTADRWLTIPIDMLLAGQTIDVSAFAASQAGVPDADTLAKAAGKAASPMPKVAKPTAPSTADVDLQMATTQLGGSCQNVLTQVESATAAIDGILSRTVLPAPHFAECMKIQSSQNPSAEVSLKTASSKKQSANGNNGNSQGSGSSAKNDTGAGQEGSFQVSPSELSFKFESDSAPISLSGGAFPYYVIPVEPQVVIDADTLNGGSSYQRFKVTLHDPVKNSYHVLAADQNGSSKIIVLDFTPFGSSSSKLSNANPKLGGG
jgi:DNA-binding FrmR family transcriptional regulator